MESDVLNELLRQISECECDEKNPCDKCRKIEQAIRDDAPVCFYEGFDEGGG